MLNFLLETSGGNTGGSGSPWITIIMIVGLVVVFYFFAIRPQRKQEKQDQEMRDSLSVGDEVTTIGGIIGKVISIKDETFVLETTKDRTKIRFLRGAIRSIDVKIQEVVAQQQAEAAAEDADTTEEPAEGENM